MEFITANTDENFILFFQRVKFKQNYSLFIHVKKSSQQFTVAPSGAAACKLTNSFILTVDYRKFIDQGLIAISKWPL